MKEQILRLGQNSVIYGVGSMLTRFVSLLLLPLFTAYLTPADYGVLALLSLLSMVVQPVVALGIGVAMGPSYFEGDDPARKGKTVWTAALLLLGSTSLLVLVAWLFPRPISLLALQSPDYGFLVSLSLTATAFSTLAVPFMQQIQFEEKAKTYVVLTLLSSLTTIGLSLVAVVYLGWGVQGMVMAQLWGQALTFVMFFVVAVRGVPFGYDRSIRNELLRLGLPLVPSFAFLFILMQSNRYVLQWFEGLDAVGIYSMGFNIGMVMNIAVGGFTQAWYPFFIPYMNKTESAGEVFGTIFRLYILVFGGAVLCFFIFANPIISILTKPVFHDAYLIVGFSALSQFFVGLFSLLTPGMYFTKEVKYVGFWQGCAALLSIPLNIVLINLWGLAGAGIALALSSALLPLFQGLWNWHRRGMYVKIDFRWGSLRYITAGFLCLIALSQVIVPQDLPLSILASLSLALILAFVIYKNLHLVGSMSSIKHFLGRT